MPRPRPSALALIAIFTVASLIGPAGAGVAIAAEPAKCTGANDRQPPATIRVLRKFGPAIGTVQTVDFWQYVGTVLRTEFSGGGFNAATLRVGAQAVKQYAWYYSIYWRGGMMNGECYDVVDSTADQLYHPEKKNADGTWRMTSQPSPANLEAMAATWHITLRKDFLAKKGKPNKMFLTGYRSGMKRNCGFEDGTFRLFQKSLQDCGVKGLTTEEMWRVYYGSNLYVVDVRDNDVLRDGEWRGDVGMLTPSGAQTAISFFGASDSGFGAPVGENVGVDLGDVLDQGVGDVTGVEVPADDPSTDSDAYRSPRPASNLADVVLLAKSGSGAGRKVWVVKSNGTLGNDRFDAPAAIDAPNGVSRVLVADFDGDLNADVGLVRSTPTEPGPTDEPTLYVMRALGNGNLSTPIPWWRGSLDLVAQTVLAGDVNSDGKADLVISDGNTFSVAPSTPSCLSLSPWGPCADQPLNRMDAAQQWLGGTGWTLANVRFAAGDTDRDGRDDIFAVVKNGSGVNVFAVRSARDGGSFNGPVLMWQGSGLDFDSVRPVGLHGDLDGFADLAMVQNTSGGRTAFWLKSAASSMSPAGTPATSNESNWGGARAF